MANNITNNIKMMGLKDLVGSLAQTNYYQVNFSTPREKLKNHLKKYANFGDDINWISKNVGLLCSDAVLPTSSFATSEVKDNFMGVTQEFAHTRLYTDIDFTFYVDNDYKMLRFFEGWMDFISGTSEVSNREGGNYYRRMNYPNDYKISEMYITKFEKDTNTSLLQYRFINTFPKSITSIPVAYGPAEILKVTVTFNYDRYIVSKGAISNQAAQDDQIVKNQRIIDAANKYNTINSDLQTAADINYINDARTLLNPPSN